MKDKKDHHNEMEGNEAVKLSIPILQNIEDKKWQNKLWVDKGNINGNKVRTSTPWKLKSIWT